MSGRSGDYHVVWSCDADTRVCGAEVSGPHKMSFSLRLPYGATFALDDRRYRVPPETPEGAGWSSRKPLPKVLFDVGADDIERMEEFYNAWLAANRETPEMVSVLDDYAGGRGKRHNLDLITASWEEACRRAEVECLSARDAALRELGHRYSIRQLLSVRHPPRDYWEARKAIHEREKACRRVEHIMGLADGRVLVWLKRSVARWPEGQPKPWEVVREQMEVVETAEEIVRGGGGQEQGGGRSHARE